MGSAAGRRETGSQWRPSLLQRSRKSMWKLINAAASEQIPAWKVLRWCESGAPNAGEPSEFSEIHVS